MVLLTPQQRPTALALCYNTIPPMNALTLRAAAFTAAALASGLAGCGSEPTAGAAAGGATSSSGGSGGEAGSSTTSSSSGGSGDGGSGGAAGQGGGIPPGWRSALYPDDWTPSYVAPGGHRIHDFSYAGYHNGEAPIGEPVVDDVFDVVAGYGADPTGSSDTTEHVQAAIDAAAQNGGGVVLFPAGLYRFDDELLITASNTVLRGEGPDQSRLYFTTSAGLSYQSHIEFRGVLSTLSEEPLAQDAPAHSTELRLDDAGAFSVGDDVAIGWVITDEFVADHGMTGVWQAFNGSWQPFFLREIVAIDTATTPHTVTIDVPTRYPALTRDQASLRVQSGYLRECGVEQLGLGNAVDWDAAWEQNQVHVLELDGVVDSWIQDVESFDPPSGPTSGDGADDHLQSGGIVVRLSKRVTVADSLMERAEHKGGGGNGYLFELRQSSEVLFRDCVGRHGRHNFIQNWGFGVTGCVWLRIDSSDGRAWFSKDLPLPQVGYSEMHHSLATANLGDSSHFEDGWSIVNRQQYSSGAGHTGTENVIWNTAGTGRLISRQWGWGYVVGTAPELAVRTSLVFPQGTGTEPEDWTEGLTEGADLYPPSLYESQLEKRLAR